VKTKAEAEQMLKDAGAEFIRTARHCTLYRLPNGKLIGFSRTPGDNRALKNFERELSRLLRA
jgi:hypothetical protein